MTRLRLSGLLALALSCGHVAAQTVGGAWLDLGPGPSFNGQVEGISNREVVGAVNALAAHPSNADILYIGATNGGIWKTVNATAASPTWTRLTDTQRSPSIGALELDPTDGTRQTLLAGIGRTSSLGRRGGTLIGLLRSTDAGASWAEINGAGLLSGRTVTGVAPRGAVLVVATTDGIYRSINTGTAFALLSNNGTSGLPAGNASDLASDVSNNARLFTALTSGTRGIYRSTDSGATWSKVSDAAVDAVFNAGAGTAKVELAVGASNNVFAAIVASNGRLAEVFRSGDAGTTWTALGVPTTAEQNGVLFGIHAGGQGGLHLSIAADPTNANIVYVGGDRQPYFGEGVPGSNQFFPNSLGANDYSGRSFRADASLLPASPWTPLTHVGTANNSAPHADSRDMTFDAAGNLLESDDGGVYKRTSPRTATGNWFSLNGSLQTTEYHGIAYDNVADRVIGGGQDTGTTEQTQLNSKVFNSVSTGDGGDTTVNDRNSTTLSSRYSSFQNLSSLRRRSYNAANALQSQVFPSLTLLNGSPTLTAEFYSPIAINEVNGLRLIIGAQNGIYESLDQGGSINRIATTRMNAIVGKPIVYGVPGNEELLYLASSNALFLRTAAAGALSQINTAGSESIRDVTLDPDLPARLFAMGTTGVFFSSNTGGNFASVIGNLASFDPGEFRSLAYVSSQENNDGLVLGADRGAFVAFESSGYSVWSRLGSGFPNALLFSLDYDRTDDVLIAGTLGRGAWKLQPVLPSVSLFRNGFE